MATKSITVRNGPTYKVGHKDSKGVIVRIVLRHGMYEVQRKTPDGRRWAGSTYVNSINVTDVS